MRQRVGNKLREPARVPSTDRYESGGGLVPNLDTLVIRTAKAPCSQEDPTAQHHNGEEAVLTETASHPDQNNEEFYASVGTRLLGNSTKRR
jgi:hypothetical protein